MTASIAAQPVTEDDGPLSPWWIRAVVTVMILGFAGLILVTTLSYQNAPPIPARVISQQGATLFTADDVGDGQAVFRRYGLMANGSIWVMAPTSGPTTRLTIASHGDCHSGGYLTGAAYEGVRSSEPKRSSYSPSRDCGGIEDQSSCLRKDNRAALARLSFIF